MWKRVKNYIEQEKKYARYVYERITIGSPSSIRSVCSMLIYVLAKYTFLPGRVLMTLQHVHHTENDTNTTHT